MTGFADVHIGTAGWAIPGAASGEFPGAGTHLQRYARGLSGVEINSSFYRPHRPATYAKWAMAGGSGFRFAVKVPREITHVRRLGAVGDVGELLDAFLGEAGELGGKLGPLLVQLPPSLAFAPAVARGFFAGLRRRFAGAVVCEPRHSSWFTGAAEGVLGEHSVARVAADPAVVSGADQPGGWGGLVYYRLHGSPVMYRSAYASVYLDTLARKISELRAVGTPVWCIFDNTAEGAATVDALGLLRRVGALVGARGEDAPRVA